LIASVFGRDEQFNERSGWNIARLNAERDGDGRTECDVRNLKADGWTCWNGDASNGYDVQRRRYGTAWEKSIVGSSTPAWQGCVERESFQSDRAVLSRKVLWLLRAKAGTGAAIDKD